MTIAAPPLVAAAAPLRDSSEYVRAATARSWQLETLGHASIAVYREGEYPVLLTDPWLIGSVYWRSWWLQHYPSEDEIDRLSRSTYVYVTHEHPDHFHTPSIRRLGSGPAYLFPDLVEPGYLNYLRERGFRAEPIVPRQWLSLAPGVSILSLPLWNEDSLLLVDTPDALILNFNDAKPLPTVLRAVRQLADRIGKPRILLSSYSPASMINGFLDEQGEPVILKTPAAYVGGICQLCEALGADLFIPFASQASFERPDSAWANDYRTRFDDLHRGWTASATRLLPPYSTVDLATVAHEPRYRSLPASDYRGPDSDRVATLTRTRVDEENTAAFGAEDRTRLAAKLNRWRWLLRALFRRGFSFRLGEQHLFYDPRRGRLAESEEPGDFEISVPALTMKEALANGHLSDLGITMLVRIRRFREVDPRRIYGLFVLFQFDDHGHLAGPRALARWLGAGLRHSLPRRLPPPPHEVRIPPPL